MLTFVASVFFLMATPGPGVLSLAGVGASFGARVGWTYGIGLFIGNSAVLLATALGLAAILQANDGLRLVFIALSSGYLVYLALRIALTGSKIAFLEMASPPGIWGGIALQAFNPKAYAMGTFVFSNFPLLPDHFGWEVAIKLTLFNVVWLPVHLSWLYAGIGLQRLDLAPHRQRAINIAMAVLMLLVVGLAMRASLFG